MNSKDIGSIHSEAFENGILKDDYSCVIYYSSKSSWSGNSKTYTFEQDNIMINNNSDRDAKEESIEMILNNKLKKYKFFNTTAAKEISTFERILRYQKNRYEESDSSLFMLIKIKLYKNNTRIYQKIYYYFSDYYRDENNNLIKNNGLLPFSILLKRCFNDKLDNVFHQDEKSKYEKRKRYIVDRFIQSLSINNQHHREVGLILKTTQNEELFYVYKDNEDKVFISPKKGKSQFSISRGNIEKILIDKKMAKSSNDIAYILPICDFIKFYIGTNTDVIDMPIPNPFRTDQVKYKIGHLLEHGYTKRELADYRKTSIEFISKIIEDENR